MKRSIPRTFGAALIGLAVTSAVPFHATIAAPPQRAAVRVPFDRQFIDMMVPHHQGAVAMARIALIRGQHQKIRDLARAIISSQKHEIGQMQTWRAAWFGSNRTPSMDAMAKLPGMKMSSMDMSMTADIKHLRTARPFDRAFLDAMIPHHQSAVMGAGLELMRGGHPQLKALARAIVSGQKREIAEMRSWRKAWYGNSGMSGMGN